MTREELDRRERLAIDDIAATAQYHLNRLPASSEWRPVLAQLHAIFARPPVGSGPQPIEPAALPVDDGSKVRLVPVS